MKKHNQAIKFAPFGRWTLFHSVVYGGRYVFISQQSQPSTCGKIVNNCSIGGEYFGNTVTYSI